jgi:endonuclease YncB( thermonuclease family)
MESNRAHRLCGRFGAPAFALAAAAALVLASAPPAVAACGAPQGVVRVADVDGRLDVGLADGRVVHLVGLDLPSPSRGAPETALAAQRFLSESLVGRDAEIDLLAAGSDRWGRVMADLAPPAAPAGIAVALLAAGHARVKPEFEARACSAERLAAEDAARRARLGLWNDPAYAVVAASDTAALHARAGQFVVIEGRVRRIGFTRSRLYVDLASHDGPTIVLARKLASTLARAGRPVEEMTGEVVRARGALEDRFRPTIEVSEPTMIEVVRPLGVEQPPR